MSKALDKDEKEWDLEGELNDDMTLTIKDGAVMKRILSYMVGRNLLIKISVFRERRSLAQNRYFHGIVVPTVKAWLKDTQGIKYTHDEVYYWLNQEVLGNKPIISEVAGVEVITMTGKRFSEMSTKQFSDAVELLFQHFDALDLHIPEPTKNNIVTDFIKDE